MHGYIVTSLALSLLTSKGSQPVSRYNGFPEAITVRPVTILAANN